MSTQITPEPTSGEKDPRELGHKPTYDEATKQEYPGTEAQMTPKADHGEQSYQGYNRLQGKVALITGGDSGIGRAVALAYAREGADVVISYLNEEEDAQETLRIVKDAGRKGLGIPGDISQVKHCQQIIERVFNEFGKLDILVNNAAFQMSHDSIEEMEPSEWDHTFATNIHAMFYLCHSAVPRMQPGSVIINTASVQAYKPSANLLAYASTKGAIVTFTKALSELVIEKGIRANVVAPGPVWTPLIPATMPEEKVKEFGKQSPMGRPAQPVELAPAYVFLATNESSYITGEVLGVTGGMPLG